MMLSQLCCNIRFFFSLLERKVIRLYLRMRSITLFLIACVLIPPVFAFPEIDLVSLVFRRQPTYQSSEMIGDLVNGATTEVGRQVRDCISGIWSCDYPAEKVTISFPLQSLFTLVFLLIYSVCDRVSSWLGGLWVSRNKPAVMMGNN